MASNQTTNYKLNQWQAEDKVLHTEFNADNLKVEEALTGLAGQVAGKAAQTEVNGLKTQMAAKAEQSGVDALAQSVTTQLAGKASLAEFNALKTTVNGKAAQSALDALKTTVNSKAAQSAVDSLNTKVAGMLRVATGSYVGNGKYGKANPNTLTFPFAPKLVVISVNKESEMVQGTVLIAGQTASSGIGCSTSSGATLGLAVSWPQNGVSWYTTAYDAENQLNETGYTYYYLVLG